MCVAPGAIEYLEIDLPAEQNPVGRLASNQCPLSAYQNSSLRGSLCPACMNFWQFPQFVGCFAANAIRERSPSAAFPACRRCMSKCMSSGTNYAPQEQEFG